MPSVHVTPQRADPYKHFKFRVTWQGRSVAGFHRMGALDRPAGAGADGEPVRAPQLPGHSRYPRITLERGVTHDPGFQKWASGVHNSSGAPAPSTQVRQDLVIEALDEAGRVARAYQVYRSWIAAFQSLPDLDASAKGVAIQILTLEHGGWELVVTPPASAAGESA